MANGFKALRHVGGGVQRLSMYPISGAYATAIFSGDAVLLNAGNVEQGVSGGANVGSFAGCMYVDNAGRQVFSPTWPGSAAAPGATEINALITEDKGVSYRVTDSTGALTVGATCDIVVGTGDTKTGQSGMSVGASVNADATVKSIIEAGVVEVVFN